MSARLFGTDGVRGVANTELTAALAFGLGQAAVRFLGKRLVIGKDTRRSGDLLESALAAGIMSAGGDAFLAGVVPTPAVAFLTRTGGFDGGVVISASHNPPHYNGIKFFDAEGFKLPDAVEDSMQRFIENARANGGAVQDDGQIVGAAVGKRHELPDAADRYVDNAVELFNSWGLSLDGLKIVVDCGHGAAGHTTPSALRKLGAQLVAINTDYNGDDINVQCGSTNLDQLKQAVAQHGADIGLAHDGDADRLMIIDAQGNEIDGDQVEAICAVDMKARGALPRNTIVSTVMCNLGLKKAMESQGIVVVTTNVGDRYVLERMRADGYMLGGEQSGHMILLEHNTTGDGLITALAVLAAMCRSGKTVGQLAQVMQRYPQALVNVAVEDKEIYKTSDEVIAAIDMAHHMLGDQGNILVRASGTEKLVRVMVEARELEQAQRAADTIAAAIAHADETGDTDEG